MAEYDNHARFTNTGTEDTTIAGGSAKTTLPNKNRLPEDSARGAAYYAANNKDILPEHVARRTAYPVIYAK